MGKKVAPKKSPYDVPRTKLTSAIRRLWFHSKNRRDCIKNAKNICAICNKFHAKLTVDHINTTVPLTGWDGDWTGYLKRMWVEPEIGLRALCHDCHVVVTNIQNQQRKIKKAKKKEKELDDDADVE